MIRLTSFNPAPHQRAERLCSFRYCFREAYVTDKEWFIRAIFTAYRTSRANRALSPEPEIRNFLNASRKEAKSITEIKTAAINLGIPPLELRDRYVYDTKIQKAVKGRLCSLQTEIDRLIAPGIAFFKDRVAKIEASKQSLLALELRYNFLTSPSGDRERKTILKRIGIELENYKKLTQRNNFIRAYKKSFKSDEFKSLRKRFKEIAKPFKNLILVPEIRDHSILFRERETIEKDLRIAESAGSRVLKMLLKRELRKIPNSGGSDQGRPHAAPQRVSGGESI